MRAAAQGWPYDDLALANDCAGLIDTVNDRALTWPKTERSRWMASQGLARLGKSVPLAAETQLPKFAQALDFSEDDELVEVTPKEIRLSKKHPSETDRKRA